MKTKLAVITALSVLWIFGGGLASELSRRERAGTALMRDKLELSQRVLEGIVTETYQLVITKGAKLSAMTREASGVSTKIQTTNSRASRSGNMWTPWLKLPKTKTPTR